MEDLTQEEYERRYALLTRKKDHPGVPEVLSHNITADKLRKFMPRGARKLAVSEDVLHMIQNVERDTGMPQEYMEETILANMYHLGDSLGISMSQYVSAVKFCVLKQNMSLAKAWAITFPMRYKLLVDKAAVKGVEPTVDISANMYDRGGVVAKITASMVVEFNIQYAPARHAAMHKLIQLMGGKSADERAKVSPTVQMNSAIAILDKTEMPADNVVQVKIGMDDESKSIQTNLAEQMAKSADIQLAALRAGKTLDEVQKLGLRAETIDVEVEE